MPKHPCPCLSAFSALYMGICRPGAPWNGDRDLPISINWASTIESHGCQINAQCLKNSRRESSRKWLNERKIHWLHSWSADRLSLSRELAASQSRTSAHNPSECSMVMWNSLAPQVDQCWAQQCGEGHGSEEKSLQGRKAISFNTGLGLLFPLAQQVSQKLSGGSDVAWRGILPSITFDILQEKAIHFF